MSYHYGKMPSHFLKNYNGFFSKYIDQIEDSSLDIVELLISLPQEEYELLLKEVAESRSKLYDLILNSLSDGNIQYSIKELDDYNRVERAVDRIFSRKEKKEPEKIFLVLEDYIQLKELLVRFFVDGKTEFNEVSEIKVGKKNQTYLRNLLREIYNLCDESDIDLINNKSFFELVRKINIFKKMDETKLYGIFSK